MDDQSFPVIPIPGEYGATEEAILRHLYEHPGERIGVADLVRALEQSFEDVLFGVETLIEQRLPKGKRVLESEKLQFINLRLTAKGEAAAIRERRRPKSIILNVPRPNRAPASNNAK
jgi:hypothetical protein